jgi:riboflavin biosynthesis pyrimidine reductase
MSGAGDHETLQALTAGPNERAAAEVLADLGLRDGGPRCVAIMIASIDGRAAIDGRSAALGHPADRALLRELRAQADALLVGTRTLKAEGYANLLDDDQRARRRDRGLPEHPLLVTWSRSLNIPLEVPVFSEEGTPVAVYTSSDAPAPEGLEVRRVGSLGEVPGDLAARGTPVVSCEGGPTLLRELAAVDAVSDLLLTIAPLLAAGHEPAILEGPAFPQPEHFELRSVHRAGDHAFLRYALPG